MDNAVQSELHGIIFVYSISDGLFNARFSCSCSDVRRITCISSAKNFTGSYCFCEMSPLPSA